MGNITRVMRNLFGTGRRLSVKWLRENEWTQELEAGYMEPWDSRLSGERWYFLFPTQAGFIVRQITD